MKASVIELLAALAALATLLLLYHRAVPWTTLRITGAALALISAALLLLARMQLGASFSAQPRARALVTSGIYSKVRHPIYTFGALLAVGVALYLEQRWLLLVVVLIVVPVQLLRARKEEQVLMNAFGQAYARYKAGTWF